MVQTKDNLTNDPAVQAYLDLGVTAFLRDGHGWFPQREDLTAIQCERGFGKSSEAILFGAHVVRGEIDAATRSTLAARSPENTRVSSQGKDQGRESNPAAVTSHDSFARQVASTHDAHKRYPTQIHTTQPRRR